MDRLPVSGSSHRRGSSGTDSRSLSRFLSRQRARPLPCPGSRAFFCPATLSLQAIISCHEPRPRPPARDRRRRPPLGRRLRADRRLHGGRGGRRHRRLLPGAALRRRSHAHRRHRAGPGAARAAAGGAAAGRQLHLWPAARGDPLGAGQRDHVAAARHLDRLRGHPAADRAARRRGRARPDRRDRRYRGEPRRGPPDRRRREAQPQRRGRLSSHPHRPLRVHRHGDRGRGDPDLGVRPRRRDRLAADRRR